MIPAHIKNRKGARSFADLDPEVIEYLNNGVIETANLIEWLAADQLTILKVVLKTLKKEQWYDTFYEAVNAQKKVSVNSNTRVIGQTFAELTKDAKILYHLASHTSDIPRCWAVYASTLIDTLNTENLLNKIKPFAADSHFGVREVTVLASKNFLIEDLDIAISILSEWILDPDENIRRYAVEVLRPLGVWVKKIAEFQQFPEKGRPIITPLKSDNSKYVRDAVGNWLNDASKSQAEWVTTLCKEWQRISPTKETSYIVKRAMRTLNKNK